MDGNETATLSVQGIVAGQTHIHNLSFRLTAGVPTAIQGLIDEWQTGCRTAYRACFRTTDAPVVLLRAKQRCGSLPLEQAEEIEVAGNQLGTRIAEVDANTLPPMIAARVRLGTGLIGRSRRGAFSLGGLLDADVSLAVLGAGYITQLNAYLTAVSTQFGPIAGAPVWRWSVVSDKLAGPGVQCQDSSANVTSFTINPNVGTMNSRKPGSGR